MADGEFGYVRGHLKLKLIRVICDGEFGEKGEWVTAGSRRSKVVSAEERVTIDLYFEAQGYEWLDDLPPRIIRRGWKNGRVISAHENHVLMGEQVAEGKDGEIVICVVIIGAWLAGKSHASERPELSLNISFEENMKVDELLRDAQLSHLLALEHHGLSVLALVEGCVIVGECELTLQVLLAILGKALGGMSRMDVDVAWTISGVDNALVLLDWAKSKNDIIMHKGEGLTGLVVGGNTSRVDFMLGLGEDSDPGVAPVRVGTVSIVGDDVLRFVGELGVFVKINAFGKKMGIEGY